MNLKNIRHLGILLLGAWVSGCTMAAKVTSTARSSMEQRLLVESLQRVLRQFALDEHAGKKVFLDLTGLTADKDFARSFIDTKLQQAGATLVAAEKDADLKLKFFANAIGVDQTETLIGLPSFGVPIIGVPVPELALFKWVKNRGYTELQAFTFNAKSGAYLSEFSPRAGRTKFDVFTILVWISFSRTDLEQPGKASNGDDAEDTERGDQSEN